MDSSIGTDSQDSDDLVPPGITPLEYDKCKINMPKKNLISTPASSPTTNTQKGIQNAKKKLRAFSIQKKTTITQVSVPKPVSTGGATVLIGKLSSVKTTPKPDKEVDAEKKPPRPPKPGASRKNLQESYTALQKRTLSEIEDMKRKMELVDLGIPLGLICPTSSNEKAMPTKAMPPIKSFLDPLKVDELIREAKKARAAGKEFKFDYQKLLPDYDNPFQRKKDDLEKEEYQSNPKSERQEEKERSERRKSDISYDKRQREKSEKKEREKSEKKDIRERDKEKRREEKDKNKLKEKDEIKKVEHEKRRTESDVNLGDYLVCDSWSLDNDDRNISSPKIDKSRKSLDNDKIKEPMELFQENLKKQSKTEHSPANEAKIEKLKPVIDAFKFDIDPNEEDDALDLFHEDLVTEKFSKAQSKKENMYDSPLDLKLFDLDPDMSKDSIIDANDDNFLESVINEIKQENMSDDTSQDNNQPGLVEYDSPIDDDFKLDTSQGSVTPELDDRMRDMHSQQSQYSDGYRSTESGYKSTESFKSEYIPKESRHRTDSCQSDYRMSVETELDSSMDRKMSRSTMDSLETWSFVLKICQPLLFRHDKNKCYKETHTFPKLWYTTNPKCCDCVKDRSVVYEELEMCKMGLVDRVYGCDQIPDASCPASRGWYPRWWSVGGSEGAPRPSTEWEDDRSTTPTRDRVGPDGLVMEYQRFIESVWPDVAEPKSETTRSTTPDRLERQESRKKKKDDRDREEDKKKVKKMKLSSEGWSQESDLEEEVEKTTDQAIDSDELFRFSPPLDDANKCKKIKTEKEKIRKRKLSRSSSQSSEEISKKKRTIKKKDVKKSKSKLAKRRRASKKIRKKLKEKKKRKLVKMEKISIDTDKEEKEKKKEKKLKKKTQMKAKKTQKKKKAKPKQSSSSSSSDSSSSSSSSDSESEVDRKKIKKKELALKKKKRDKKKKRKVSTDSTQSDDLFDVNILNNIKTERLTDDEKNQQMNDFSPRRQKKTRDREIINVKELQNDFVGNNIHIKQEKEDIFKETVSEVIEEAVNTVPEKSSEQKAIEVAPALVEVQTEDTDNKEQPSPEVEMLSPESPEILEDSQIPLPEESLESYTTNNEPATIHLTADSNIPLPAEIKMQNIPEPPPKIIPEKVTQETVKCQEVQPQLLSYDYSSVSENQNELYGKGIQDVDDKVVDSYDHENYDMYEQMAMAYQTDVDDQDVLCTDDGAARPIETVVRRRRGEIKCDWRADRAAPPAPPPRPSRWGLKPGEVNIVLTGGPSTEPATPKHGDHPHQDQYPIRSVLEPQQTVYKIQSLANRQDASNTSIGYDEAYQVTYGASDRLQYGDCFGEPPPSGAGEGGVTSQPVTSQAAKTSTLDARIDRALRMTVLGDVAKETEDPDKDSPEKGILVTKSLGEIRAGKRVSFADGYTPGQDSDTEEPPVKRQKKKSRRYGCAWPCPATHPDHVPLWDALPPPPPPPAPPPPRSPPPPPAARAPPLHLLRQPPPRTRTHVQRKQDPAITLPPFMPPEPPPGLITFQ